MKHLTLILLLALTACHKQTCNTIKGNGYSVTVCQDDKKENLKTETLERRAPNKEERLDAYKYSTEYGCLVGATYSCSQIFFELQRYSCMEEARTGLCPKVSESFRKFMAQE